MGQLIPYHQIAGYVPALDRRQLNKPSVLIGANFLVDAEGPYSAFGSELPQNYNTILSPNKITPQTFVIEGQSYLFIDNAVLAYDTTAQLYYAVFTFAAATEPFPWTKADVGGKYYFAKKGANIIQFDPLLNSWKELSGGSFPDDPYAVAVGGGGRLFIAAKLVVAWSEIDNGENVVPNVSTGVGFQLLAIIGNGTPLGCYSVPNGVLTFTTQGILMSEAVDSLNPFRHYPLSREHVPINAFCVIDAQDDQIVLLTKTGFYRTLGALPQPWQPLMSEYMHRQFFPAHNLTNQTLVKLSYNHDLQWFLVSLSDNEALNSFDRALVLYIPRDEWGIFSNRHVAFGALALAETSIEGFNFGYISEAGFVHKFNRFPRVEIVPDLSDPKYYYKHTTFTSPARIENDIYIFTDRIKLTDFNPTIFPEMSGLYILEAGERAYDPAPIGDDGASGVGIETEDWLLLVDEFDADIEEDWNSDSGDEDWGDGDLQYIFSTYCSFAVAFDQLNPTVYSPQFGAVNAYVEIGPIRITDNQSPGQTSYLTELAIGMGLHVDGQEFDDYMDLFKYTADINEDWLIMASVFEDWGFNVFDGIDYGVQIRGSLDLERTFEDQLVTPDLIKSEGQFDYYSTYITGLYHSVIINALEVNQSFHAKILEAGGTLGGRL